MATLLSSVRVDGSLCGLFCPSLFSLFAVAIQAKKEWEKNRKETKAQVGLSKFWDVIVFPVLKSVEKEYIF